MLGASSGVVVMVGLSDFEHETRTVAMMSSVRIRRSFMGQRAAREAEGVYADFVDSQLPPDHP